MKKRFVANIALLVFINLLVKPFWIFGIDRTVQNAVGTGAYGVYFALFNFSFLLQTLLDFGINNYNSRAVAQKDGWIAEHFTGIMLVKTALAVIYLLLCLAGAGIMGYSPAQIWLLGILCLNQVLVSFTGYFRSNLQGLHHFKTDSFMSVLDKLVMIAICAVLLWGGSWGSSFRIEWFVYAQSGAYLFTVLVGLILVVRHIPLPWQVSIDWSFIRGILQKSYPFALIGVLMSVYNRIDSVMLEALLPPTDGAHQAGIYASAYRLLDAVNMVGVLTATILLPMFAKMLVKQEPVEPLVNFTAKSLYALATAGVCCCFYFAEPVMHWLYTDATPYYATVFAWLMPSFIGIASVYVFGALLTANHNLWQINVIALGSVALNITLNFLLIPSFKALGAAWAAVATQAMAAVCFMAVAAYKFKLGWNGKNIVLAAVYPLICLTLAKWGSRWQWGIPWQFNFLAVFGLCLVFAWVLRLLVWKKTV